jgi:hypothetical protein
VDARTTHLLGALDHLGVALLIELLEEASTESALVAALRPTSQPTVNRRLQRLSRARLVAQEPGGHGAPGRMWAVIHRAETEALLGALFALSEAIDVRDRARRQQARRRLKRARAGRLGIKAAGYPEAN